jgi:hypothetical protein
MKTTAKQRKTAKQPPATRLCLKCNQVKRLTDFYTNRDWIDQAGRDTWCKSCVGKCKTKDEMREYFWENHREFTEEIWKAAQKKAKLEASKNENFQKLQEDRRQIVLDTLTCQHVPSVMQGAQSYRYVDNSQDVNITSYEEAKEAGHIVETVDPNVKTWSHEFNGDFKPKELEFLQEYYSGLENDFELNDTSLRDNAKKLAKASLLVDKVQNDYMAGRCDFSVVKDAVAQFDLLMKTGNFAACKRKPGERGGLGSWAELTMKLETTGYPCVRKIEWPKDDVDRTIEEFRYIVESLGLDTV